jgi:hypothetical protein
MMKFKDCGLQGCNMHSVVAFYARYEFLKTSHISRQVILAEFSAIRIISNFVHKVRLH